MSENGRLGRLNGIVNAFDKIMSAHKGEVTATVTTAKVKKKVFFYFLRRERESNF